ncbi:hypothetical protein KQX54_013251 [Cotesia glomerata]|uniref:Uncharacterized protein n=1 Tax=Cotesia glomerata TaxID=32391 RepID=A0AAV7HEA6_COTGL|nr:hypothetical protein KQX54_013251 [Cotesia glomerata]
MKLLSIIYVQKRFVLKIKPFDREYILILELATRNALREYYLGENRALSFPLLPSHYKNAQRLGAIQRPSKTKPATATSIDLKIEDILRQLMALAFLPGKRYS